MREGTPTAPDNDPQAPPRPSGRERYVRAVVAHPKLVLLFWVVLIAASVALLPGITKETGVDRYLPANHPTMERWRETNAIFDLYDPVVVLIDSGQRMGIFTPESLNAVAWFSERMAEVGGIEPAGIRSISTEDRIVGTEEGIAIEPLMAEVPSTQEEAESVQRAVMGYEPYLGTLVSDDGSAAVITARLVDGTLGGAVYHELMALADRAPLEGQKVYVAGESVMGDYLGEILDRDAFRLNPLVALVVGVTLFFSYYSFRGVALPGLAALSGAVVSLGVMALFGIPYYLMTNILPAVLLAIGVAYGLHLVGEFYERVAMHPEEDKAERIVRTMLRMWRPVLYTAFTDVAAFLDLALTSSMPPIKRFGMLSSLGVSVTYAFTIMAIPAALMLLPTRRSRVFRPAPAGGHHYASDLWHQSIDALKRFVVAYPWHITLVSGALALAAAWAATGLRVDDARVSSFSPSEPIYAAEHAINRATAGTVEMDIVVETNAPEDLYRPDYLRRIEALQRYAETLPKVGGTQSMVDFLKELHRALAGGDIALATIPDSEEMIAQAFLLASMGKLSEVLTHYVDTDYRRANLRVFVKSGYHSDIKVVHEALEHYVRTEFNSPGMEAHLSGRMDMFYTWMESVASDHFVGVIVGLAMVWLVVSLSFRYFWIGLYTVIPVSATLVGIYAAMAISGITLGVGTAAFAAVAIGLTVDFAIHVLDHMIVLARDEGRPLPEAVTLMYPSTGRPVLFSFLCVFLGMCVLTQSALPPIYLFAVLLAISLVVSFLASLVLLPALLLVAKPSFLKPRSE